MISLKFLYIFFFCIIFLSACKDNCSDDNQENHCDLSGSWELNFPKSDYIDTTLYPGKFTIKILGNNISISGPYIINYHTCTYNYNILISGNSFSCNTTRLGYAWTIAYSHLNGSFIDCDNWEGVLMNEYSNDAGEIVRTYNFDIKAHRIK